MSVGVRDPHTGYLTTGHEWNGITELNTPVPRPIYFFLAVTTIFAIVYWILMPAWPLGTTYTKGLLGVDQRTSVAESLRKAAAERSAWIARIEAGSLAELRRDAAIMHTVRQTGRTLFGDNCAACHGSNARGGPGFPDLTATTLLWGDDLDRIAETIRVGVNSEHPDTRTSQMPAFGQVLTRAEIGNVITYIRSLSASLQDAAQEAIAAGRAVFEANCAACHGERATGSAEAGAPNLSDSVWLYGGDPRSLWTTITRGRQGHMPSWETRLTAVERKILALYVATLRSDRQ